MASSAFMALVATLIFDRFNARREARCWRPLALMTVHQLSVGVPDLEETLLSRALEFCERTYEHSEIPDGRDYFELLFEALLDPVTWEPVEEVPGLLESLEARLSETESHLMNWAPLLIADPSVALIGAHVTMCTMRPGRLPTA